LFYAPFPVAAAERSSTVDGDSIRDSQAPQADEVHPAVLGPITVVAPKPSRTVEPEPQSVQSFTGEDLQARGIDSTQQLGFAVPALHFGTIAGFPIVFMRGVGSDNFVPTVDPGVTTYIDGMYMPNGAFMLNSLVGVQSVDVLKGPQGTAFGRNADAGAINIVTREPDSRLRMSAGAEFGSFRDRAAQLAVSGPLTPWLAAGIDGSSSRIDSYYSNAFYKADPDLLSDARIKLFFHPSENLTLDLTGYRSLQSGVQTLIANNVKPSLIGKLGGIKPQPDDFVAQNDFPAGTNSSQSIAYSTLTWKLPRFDLKLLGNYQNLRTSYSSADFDGSPAPMLGLATPNTFTKLQTGELQIRSNRGSWYADRLAWTAGLYYLQSQTGSDPGFIHAGPGPATSVGINGGSITLAVRGVLGTIGSSAYAQATYRIAERLGVTLGGRMQHDDRYLVMAQTDFPHLLGSGPPHVVQWPRRGTMEDNFSPKAALSLRASETVTAYVSYTVGYKSGTYNIVNIFKAPDYVVPEKVIAYEIGTQYAPKDGRLSLSLALFDNHITNMQSGFVSLASAGTIDFVTVPHARAQGGEIDGRWIPFSRHDPLVLSINVAYVDAVYTDFPQGPGFRQGTGLYSGKLDLTGDETVYTPRWSGTLSAERLIHAGKGVYTVGFDEYYNSGYYTDAYNTVRQGTFAVLNARTGYLYEPWNLSTTAFCQNMLDRRYSVVDQQTDVGEVRTLARPRQYGVRVNWQF
jgi:iron complex outermembrane receptor protein